MSSQVSSRPEDSHAEITAGPVQYAGQGAEIMAYLAQPAGSGPFPAVLVCHEIFGLTEHIKDVARRFAAAGYVALAVDLLSRDGGTARFADIADIRAALQAAPPAQFVEDFRAGLRYLQAQSNVYAERIGMTGFCFGGGVTWRCATQIPELKAVVPFYGPNPPLEDVPNIQAAVLALYGENDPRIMAGVPAIDEAMRQHGKIYEKVVYAGAEHGFHNDTGARYHPEAAADAWKRMLAWFGKYLQ